MQLLTVESSRRYMCACCSIFMKKFFYMQLLKNVGFIQRNNMVYRGEGRYNLLYKQTKMKRRMRNE